METEKLGIKKILPTDYFADDTFNAILDDIDIKVVGIDHLVSGEHWTIRKPETSYVRKDVVRWPAMKSHQYAECIVAGITSSSDTINNYTTGDIVYDGDVVWRIWSLTEQNDANGGIIKIWLSGYEYKKGDAALYGKSIYRCIIDHTATSFLSDSSKWQEIYASIRPFTVSVYYKTGDTVLQGNLIYKCLTDYVSTNFSADISNWELVGNLALLHEWEENKIYHQDEIVTHNGQIYRALSEHTSTTDIELDSSNWELITASIPLWKTGTYYIENSIVHHNNILYKCIDDHISGLTFDNTKWQILHDPNAFIRNWSANTKYYQNQVVKYAGNLYRCITENNDSVFTIAKWELLTDSINEWVASVDYVVGQYVNYNGSLYKCIVANNDANFTIAKWQKVSGGGIDTWASNNDYSVGDIVVYNNKIYSCNTGHTSGTAFLPDANKWTEISACITRIPNWEITTDYVVGDLVSHDAKIFRCTSAHKSDSTWSQAEEAKWEELSPTINEIGTWTPSTDYEVGQLVIHNNKLYRCNTAHTSDSTSFNADIAYWDVIGSSGIDDWEQNKLYSTNSVVIYNNKIYKCNTNHTSGSTFDTTKWDEISSTDVDLWKTSTNYKVGNLVIKDNQLYRCITAHTSDSSDFSADISKWNLLDTKWLAKDWVTNTLYFADEVILYDNTPYRCTTTHTSLGTFELDKFNWEPLSANIREWVSGTTYKVGDTVIYENEIWKCVTANSDIGFKSTKWVKLEHCNIRVWEAPQDPNVLALLHFDHSDCLEYNEYGDDFTRTLNPVSTGGKFNSGYDIHAADGTITSPQYSFTSGTEVYTIEFWLYYWPDSYGRNSSSNVAIENIGRAFDNVRNVGHVVFFSNSYQFNPVNFIRYDWNHMAFIITSTECTVFINGVKEKTITRPNSLPIRFVSGGTNFSTTAAGRFILDELRISNIARYTSNFSVPTEPFKTPSFSGYKKDDLVVYEDKIYRALVANNDVEFDKSKWVEVSKSQIPLWETSTPYVVGDIVIYDSQTYRCITAHTSGTFLGDISKWQVLDTNWLVNDWLSNKLYLENQVVSYGSGLWKCLETHESVSEDSPANAKLYESSTNVIDVNDTTTIPYSETIDLGSVKKVTDIDYTESTTDMSFTYTIEVSADNVNYVNWDGVSIDARYIKLTVDSVNIVSEATSPNAHLTDFTVYGDSDKWEKISSGGSADINYATNLDIDNLFN